MCKKFFILSLILLLSASQQDSPNSCTCQQLLSEADCNINIQMYLGSKKKMCSKFIDLPSISYCNSFNQMNCPNTYGCAWVDNQCTFFTGYTPFSKTTDPECQAISNRCITDGFHCVEIDNCNTYKKQLNCVKDLKKKLCFWDTTNNMCFDTDTCDKLSKIYKSDDECRNQIKTCTTKADGGCVESGENCSDQLLKIQCVWNKLKTIRCFWDGISCKDKICDNAPSTLTTNLDCEQFLQGCITKSNGGCVQNGACSVANIQIACIKNSNNVDCFWNETCLEKTCNNAPLRYNTQGLCQEFLQICSVKEGGGCQNKICSDAPRNLITNGDCENYFPGNNQVACIKDFNGQDCFWDSKSGNCKLKTCENAPEDNNTHELCQQFLVICTVNSKNTGCIEKTCENSLSQQICDKDINNKQCIWKNKCYEKQCGFASLTLKTHQECQNYLSSCTLNNTGSGCMIIPLKCQAIAIQESCQIKADGQLCGWTGNQCIDKSCSTAPKILSTTQQCQAYLSNCVSNQPFNGCQDLPLICAARKSFDNFGFPKCLWVSQTISCVEKSCATANIQGTTGALSNFTLQDCQNYLNGCVSNTSSDGCILQSLITCSNINKQNHNDCYNTFNQCTVNNEGTSCQQLETLCSNYQTSENCRFTQLNKNCIWTGQVCRNAICTDAPDTTSYDTDEECQAYLTINESCTVIEKVGFKGCVQKLSNCQDYMSQSQCHQTITNITANDDCKWIINKCYSISTFTGLCSSFKGTKEMCEAYKQGCTNDIQASSQVNCILDCTLKKKTDKNLSFQDCQTLDPTCSVRKDGSNCIKMLNSCDGYGQIQENCFKSSKGYCVMNDNSTCQSITKASDCKFFTGFAGLDHNQCQLYHKSCTSLDDGKGCQEYQKKCQAYSEPNNCTISYEGKCYFIDSYCTRFSICQSIKKSSDILTNTICANYNKDCTTNLDGSACQERKETCFDYWNDQNACTFSKSDKKCYWTGQKCINIENPSTDCGKINRTDGDYEFNATCTSHHEDCIGNYNWGSCQEKKSTCDEYKSQDQCSISKAVFPFNQCTWDDDQCIASCSVITTQEQGELDDAICASFNIDCTVNYDGSRCEKRQSTCNDYWFNDCTFSKASPPNNICIWTDEGCRPFLNVSTDCYRIKQLYGKLSASKCASYHLDCTSLSDGTGCQQKKAACKEYIEQNECVQQTDGKYCIWFENQCNIISATSCSIIKKSDLNHSKCQAYNLSCTVNFDGTSCQDNRKLHKKIQMILKLVLQFQMLRLIVQKLREKQELQNTNIVNHLIQDAV
ncbi:unnamed protein product [Paramecium sonneborni]|uniref:Uncharacterized protein n=1 Tax=Paramecium sonneborni TaxID=65129 RepID=A0A8S1JU22_9CILI|nr:unnamed protein product [Paramecium sonneborni]